LAKKHKSPQLRKGKVEVKYEANEELLNELLQTILDPQFKTSTPLSSSADQTNQIDENSSH